MVRLLGDSNYGVLVKGGVEAAVHGLDLLVKANSDAVILKFDGRQAFQQVSMDIILKKIWDTPSLQRLYPFVYSMYAQGAGHLSIYDLEGIVFKLTLPAPDPQFMIPLKKSIRTCLRKSISIFKSVP